jgi:hypothetical protein
MNQLVAILTLIVVFLVLGTGQALAEYVDDNFETWRNPFVAEGWTESIHGAVTGGEFNQVYNAGQGISCGGDGKNFKSVYRDIPVVPGVRYAADVYVEANTTWLYGDLNFGAVRMFMQFDEVNGRVLATHGRALSEWWLPPHGTGPDEIAVEGVAPPGAHHVRVVLQVVGVKGGGAVFHHFNLFKDHLPYKAMSGPETIAGPDFVRNTEWLGGAKVQQLWTAYSEGGGPGDYVMRPLSGSAQGISVAGPQGSYREIWRFFDVNPGVDSNRAVVSAVTNATNQNGIRDSSQLEMHMLYYDGSGRLLPGGGMSNGAWADGRTDAARTELSVHTPTPPNASKLQIVIRVLAGTGGGAVFDNFQLHSYRLQL